MSLNASNCFTTVAISGTGGGGAMEPAELLSEYPPLVWLDPVGVLLPRPELSLV